MGEIVANPGAIKALDDRVTTLEGEVSHINVAWLLTNTTANSWEKMHEFTLPAGKIYLVAISQSWSNGQPLGLRLDNSSGRTIASAEGNDVEWLSGGLLPSGTYSIYTKRNNSNKTNNYQYHALAFNI